MIKNMYLGLQLYSIRDFIEKDFLGTLKKVKEMGYEGVEFAGLFGKSAAEVKSMLAESGLVGISAHVPIEELLGDTPGVIGKYKEIGCRYIAIPWLSENRRPGNPDYQQTLSDIEAIGREADKQGIKLLYHNHDFEFVKVNGSYALDLMYEGISAEYLGTQVDTCWANVAGVDPSEYVLKYKGRAPMVHLKDFVMPGKKPAKMYELIGVEDTKTKTDEDQTEKFELRPVGYGVQNIPAILEASREAGAEWVIVEQDEPSMGKTPMECAEMSIDYLNTLK